MNKFEHTPGRWHVNVHNGGDYYGNITADLGMRDGVGQISTIAVILKYPLKEQWAANANLIVAAPELLEVLQSLVANILEYERGANLAPNRWSSKHFGKAMEGVFATRDAARLYGENADSWLNEHRPDLKHANHWHNFFVVIGFDQLIHHVTLAGTFWLAASFAGR